MYIYDVMLFLNVHTKKSIWFGSSL